MGWNIQISRSVQRWRNGDGKHDDKRMATEGEEESSSSLELPDARNRNEKLTVDNRAVVASRVFMVLVLLVSSSVLATLTYHFVHAKERESFENTFEDLASEIIDISQDKVKKAFGVLDGLSVSATSFTMHDDQSNWPYVTIPNFESRGETARSTAQALIISFLPLVSDVERTGWEEYSVQHQGWIQEGLTLHALNDPEGTATEINTAAVEQIPDHIYAYGPKDRIRRLEGGESECSSDTRRHLGSKEPVLEPIGSGPYSPVWQLSPSPPANNTGMINYNLFDKPVFQKAVDFVAYTRKPAFLDVCNQAKWFGSLSGTGILQTVIVQPVFDNFEPNAKIVGHFIAVVPWSSFFEDILPPSSLEVNIVLRNTCDEVFSFSVDGKGVQLMSDEEDMHDTMYDDLGISSPFAEFANPEELLESGLFEHCVYTIHAYPTQVLDTEFQTKEPLLYSIVVLGVFLFTSFVFVVYDCTVQQRQLKFLKEAAKKHEAIVSSLFPANVRDRVFSAARETAARLEKQPLVGAIQNCSDDTDNIFDSKPIADLFPEATVMFCDISGFTAWSSVRDPEQVFTLLERVYHSFDTIAKRRGVFKVETVGDSYVAVAGLPEKRKDHAIIMAQFARDCLQSFYRVTKRLELVLGPDTTELNMRVGLHSGPVTAGVLRGEKARFQLFGDTVNTAARMESTSLPGKIQLSQEMAELIRERGFVTWIKEREDVVVAKGKGALVTFWLTPKQEPGSMNRCGNQSHNGSLWDSSEKSETIRDFAPLLSLDRKSRRLVEWNAALLRDYLKKIVALRAAIKTHTTPAKELRQLESQISVTPSIVGEVQEIIELPDHCKEMLATELNGTLPDLPEDVELQLNAFVSAIASLYRENSFHCFEHANHVSMSTYKLLSRIVAPVRNCRSSKTLHDHTYGITSDPLTQFSVLLAALIHDIDHQGVPNSLLVKQDPDLAKTFKHKSVAEQNSVDIAWNTLMGSEFEALRNCIYCNESELRRFRQLIVNSVMATDIFDKELGGLRKARWEKAFSNSTDPNTKADVNRKATIVIEHLIQASDVSHTMQHWHIYEKWNSRLFEEMYYAFQKGLTDNDPSEGWYKGEIWFFDNYIIPLAKKLENCGVFGVSSDEFLNYAVANRREWESKGKALVQSMVEKCKEKDETP